MRAPILSRHARGLLVRGAAHHVIAKGESFNLLVNGTSPASETHQICMLHQETSKGAQWSASFLAWSMTADHTQPASRLPSLLLAPIVGGK